MKRLLAICVLSSMPAVAFAVCPATMSSSVRLNCFSTQLGVALSGISALQAENATLQSEVTSLEADLAALEAENIALQNEMAAQISWSAGVDSALVSVYGELDVMYATFDAALSTLEAEVGALSASGWVTIEDLQGYATESYVIDYVCEATGNCALPYTTTWDHDMLAVSPGSFSMGGGAGDPSSSYTDHDVTLTHTFWIGEHEVTQDEWAAWTEAPDPTPSYFTGGLRPVEMVSWTMAAQYANALSAEEGLTECYLSDGSAMVPAYESDPYACPGYRLPTEAEWEYAARAGEDTTYSGSNTVGNVAWYYSNSGGTTHNVCLLDPNASGHCDMSGNAFEWTNDWYGASYGGYGSGAASTDPAGPSSGIYRVFRGGSWGALSLNARVTYRNYADADYTSDQVGFRLARSSL